jgi:hypothetical protein
MADHEEMKLHEAAAPSGGQSGMSRRAMLRGAASAGAAGLASAALLGGPAAAAMAATKHPPAARRDDSETAQPGESVVVHVRDLRTGEIDLFRGTSHTRIHDRDLASRLARASH